MKETKNDDMLFNNAFSILMTLILFDIIFTWYGLEHGFTEQNPILNYIILNSNLLIGMSILVLFTAFITLLLYYLCQIIRQKDAINVLFLLIGWKLCVVATWIGVLIK